MKTMKRTAAPDVAQLMADNGWKQVDSVTWRKPSLTVSMYLGEQEVENNDNPATVDFGEVKLTVSNVVVHAVNGEYDASLDYKGTKYQGDLVYEDLVDLVNENDPYLTPEFDFDLTDLLIAEELDRMDDEEDDTEEARRARLEKFEQAVADGWKADGDVLTRDHMDLKYNVGPVRVEFEEESTIKDFGTVDVEVENLTLKLFNDGAYLKFTYAGKVYEGGVDMYSVAAFLDNSTLDREFNTDLDQVITQNVVDNYTPEAREGQQHSRLRRTAISDVAKLLVDNGWEPEVDGDNMWFKAKLTCCLYVGEWGAYDYDDVEFNVTDASLQVNDDGSALLSFTYDQVEYDGLISQPDDLQDLIAYGILPDDFNEALYDPVVAKAAGDLVDAAEQMRDFERERSWG